MTSYGSLQILSAPKRSQSSSENISGKGATLSSNQSPVQEAGSPLTLPRGIHGGSTLHHPSQPARG